MGEIRQRPVVRERGLVELSGEFDLRDLGYLREKLDEAGRRKSVVDLSGITFLDLQATRELAVRLQLHDGSLVFEHPSWAVLKSIAVCGYEPWFGFGAEETGDVLAAGPRNRREVSSRGSWRGRPGA